VQAGGSCQEGTRWMEKTGGKETECSCSKGSTLCEVAATRGEPVLLCGVDVTSGKERRVGDQWTEECNTCRCLNSGVPACTKRICSLGLGGGKDQSLNPKTTGTESVNFPG